MSAPSRNIVFLGTHGQYNIGDELLLDTFLTQLGAQHRYVVNSYDPSFTAAQLAGRFTVEVIDTAGGRVQLLRKLMRCDLLCFGGGSIIKELYASTGRNRYSTLLMILAIVFFTRRIARKPIAMFNVGVGPLLTRQGHRLARMILANVDELTVRDERSVRTCRAIGIDAVLVPDAVFSVDPATLVGRATEPSAGSGQQRREPGRRDAPLRVALNLNFDIENPENWELFLSRLAEALDGLHARYPIEVHALPMQAGFKRNDDAEILDGFAARVPSITMVRHELATHVDAARLIESCDLVLSERLHAIVMASILGVPSLALAYDVKVVELASRLGLAPWTIDINVPFASDDVIERVVDLIENREAVSERVRERSAELGDDARTAFERARRWVAERR